MCMAWSLPSEASVPVSQAVLCMAAGHMRIKCDDKRNSSPWWLAAGSRVLPPKMGTAFLQLPQLLKVEIQARQNEPLDLVVSMYGPPDRRQKSMLSGICVNFCGIAGVGQAIQEYKLQQGPSRLHFWRNRTGGDCVVVLGNGQPLEA